MIKGDFITVAIAIVRRKIFVVILLRNSYISPSQFDFYTA